MRRVSRALTRRICVRSCPGKVQGDLHTTEGEGFHLPECDEIGKCDIETGDVEVSPFIGVAVSSEVGIAFHQVDGGTVPQGEDEAPLFEGAAGSIQGVLGGGDAFPRQGTARRVRGPRAAARARIFSSRAGSKGTCSMAS